MMKFNIEPLRPTADPIFDSIAYENSLVEYNKSDTLKPIYLNFHSDKIVGYITSIRLTDDKKRYIAIGSIHSPYDEIFKDNIQNKTFTLGTKIEYDIDDPDKYCHIQKHVIILN